MHLRFLRPPPPPATIYHGYHGYHSHRSYTHDTVSHLNWSEHVQPPAQTRATHGLLCQRSCDQRARLLRLRRAYCSILLRSHGQRARLLRLRFRTRCFCSTLDRVSESDEQNRRSLESRRVLNTVGRALFGYSLHHLDSLRSPLPLSHTPRQHYFPTTHVLLNLLLSLGCAVSRLHGPRPLNCRRASS